MSILSAVTPDPLTYGQSLTITGSNLDKTKSVIIDGVGREFTLVNSATIRVDNLPLMTPGLKSVYVEFI